MRVKSFPTGNSGSVATTRRQLPADVAAALERVPQARDQFFALAADRQDAWLSWIERARGRRGRAARIDDMVRRLAPSGTAVAEEEYADPAGPPPERYWWLWLLLLLLLVIGGLLAWYFLTRDNDKTTVPNVIGLGADAAAARIHDKGLDVTPQTGPSDRPPNVVFAEKPGPGTQLDKGQSVTIFISRGRKTVADVVGLPLAQAQTQLTSAGFKVEVKHVASSRPKGIVVGQQPVAGVTAATGTTVELSVSSGAATTTSIVTTAPSPTVSTPTAGPVQVPRVVALAQTPALRRLNVLGLRPVVVYVASSQPANRVTGQSPAPGTTLRKGSRVRIRVSTGPNAQAPVSVPNVVGQDQATAAQTLQSAGFKVAVLNRPTSDQSKDGLVVEQQPRAGSSIPGGLQVTIFIGRFTG